MAKLFVRKCPCLRPKIEEDVKVLDYRHCSLNDVPGEVFNFERTLEELLVDSNQIKDLPRELFYCHGLRKLSLSDNEIKQIPGAIGHLISLENLDLSKNGVIDIPESIKTCKYLQIVDASVNPLGKLPDGFTQLLNMTQLYLNDTFLDYLPGNFGRLSKLKILEIRENHLKTLPKSFSRLVDLEKLDLGQNEFSELPDVIGSLSSLLELWCDNNQIQSITPTIGNLKQLMFFDGCKNCLQSLPSEIDGCTSLADIHLTTNQLQSLPDSIGELGNLTTLKVDDNCLTALPSNLGGLSSVSEINVSANNLQELPSSLGLLRYLRTLYADENELTFIPAELGSCSGITVLSLRSNRLSYIPDEIGRIPRLRVLNLSSNQLRCLPFTIVKLKELQALWLSENQTRPLIPLQSEHEPDTGRKILTCYLLPQRQLQDSGDHGGDTDSFHASMWEEERHNRQQIHFEFGDESDVDGSLIRQPTPYPKEMREKARHLKNLALRQQMSNGAVVRQGEDNPAYEESPSMEHLTLINQEGDGIDPRMRESRGHKPGSPSIHDPYTLFKYDKEKLARDKARMQQRHSQSYEQEDERQSPRKHRSRDNSPAASDRGSRRGKDRGSRSKIEDDDDGGFQGPRVSSLGSTPDIPSAERGERVSAAKFTYCSPEELSQNVSLRSDSHRSHGSHPRSHRHRRMRDYDSDTGYRSDQELMKFRRQQHQMFQRANDNYSEIVPVARSKGRRRDGYSSDLEGYSQRSMGAAYRETNGMENGNSKNNSRACSVGFDLSPSKSNVSLSQYSQNGAVKNDELYEHSLTEPSKTHYPSASPSPLQRRNVVDQSTPLTPTATRSNNNKKDAADFEFKKDLFNVQDSHRADGVIDPENRYMPHTSHSQGSGALLEDGRPIPPYKPAPPYASSPAQRKLPPTPSRSSPHGVSMYDRQARNSPMKEFQQRMPDIQESRDSNPDLALNRSRSQLHRNNDIDLQGYRPSDSNNQGNYLELQNGQSESPRTSTSDSANVSRSFIGHHQGDVTSASSKDSGNYSYHDRTVGESPVNFRNSPSSGLQERQGSRNSPSDYMHDPRRNFDRYDHSFREPTTVHIPTRYDEIAMFKSAEPPSQVSSSTDSGYGHNLFDKMLEVHRFSGNKGSPSPDQFNSDSNCTSTSSHPEVPTGQYSRGSTPVNHQDVQTREGSDPGSRFDRFRVTITKNPGLGFSIAGGKGVRGNPFRPNDLGIFVTKVQQNGPASSCLRPGDKLLEVNGIDFTNIEHTQAVGVLKSTEGCVQLCVERMTTS